MYSLGAYGSMVADRVRVEAYAEALRRTVRKGSVVVEIGTGPGIFAVLACQFGAERVYAIEPSEIIQVAREIAAANGCADKIDFFEQLSNRVTLPVRADIILSDLRGILPLFERHIPAIADARRRFLAPGGIMIPRKDKLWAAIVETPKLYSEMVDPWEQNPFGQDLEPARLVAVNDTHKARVSPSQLLTEHRLCATLDYATVENTDFQGNLEWAVKRPGTGHGISVWFDADLAEGIGFSNAPSAPETVYGSLFFPWTRPVPLAQGQTVCVSLAAKLVESEYVWRWTTRTQPLEGSGASLIHFEQSQLNGMVLSTKHLHKIAADYIPELSEEGILRRRTFELMDGKIPLEEIARRLATEFPERFPRWQQALSYAGVVSREYSR
ncbi:MAG TPA: 50S ribosomal protein L11 methyltransferase [Candidatus Acidoferrum sp.]|nr:50S ribosomal protein L11 methyltransferase [Candidatus Acidoferrum sp.]